MWIMQLIRKKATPLCLKLSSGKRWLRSLKMCWCLRLFHYYNIFKICVQNRAVPFFRKETWLYQYIYWLIYWYNYVIFIKGKKSRKTFSIVHLFQRGDISNATNHTDERECQKCMPSMRQSKSPIKKPVT